VELELARIVVSTDFSEIGDQAIPTAFRLAADHGARVRLVHVMERSELPNPLYAHYHPVPTPEQQRQAEDSARAALAERVPAAYRERVAHELVVARGEPAEEILKSASEPRADLVVISTHGGRGLVRATLGSVSDRVVARAPCSVLLVR
jgi:nucleotide-binding universal stress UspA family protein